LPSTVLVGRDQALASTGSGSTRRASRSPHRPGVDSVPLCLSDSRTSRSSHASAESRALSGSDCFCAASSTARAFGLDRAPAPEDVAWMLHRPGVAAVLGVKDDPPDHVILLLARCPAGDVGGARHLEAAPGAPRLDTPRITRPSRRRFDAADRRREEPQNLAERRIRRFGCRDRGGARRGGGRRAPGRVGRFFPRRFRPRAPDEERALCGSLGGSPTRRRSTPSGK
jgi:hypothetical protein